MDGGQDAGDNGGNSSIQVADSTGAFLTELNNVSETGTGAPEGMVVVCDEGSCVPFSTRESGNNDSAAFLRDNFFTFDSNGDGEVETSELESWSKKFEKSSDVQGMTDLVADHATELASLVEEGDGKGEKGITEKDLKEFERIQKKDPEDRTKEEAGLIAALDLEVQKKIRAAKKDGRPGGSPPTKRTILDLLDW